MTGSHKSEKGETSPLAPSVSEDAGRRKRSSNGKTWLLGATALAAVAGAVFTGVKFLPSEDTADNTPAAYAAEAVLPSALPQAYFKQTKRSLCEPFQGFQCTVEWEESRKPVGALVSQLPAAGEASEEVALTYSSGPRRVTVPILAGLSETELPEALWELGLKLGKVDRENSSSPASTVIEASEEPTTVVANGTRVAVVVSTGRVAVPDWTGKPREFIEADARNRGILVTFSERKVEDVPVGLAIRQSLKDRTIIATRTVQVFISSAGREEPLEIPTVVGLTEDEAISLLASEGFVKINTVTRGALSEESVVTSITPEAGESARPSDEITLTVGVAPTKN